MHVQLLGSPEARLADGTPVTPRGAKAWALLAYVLVAGRPVPRARLAGLLFPDAADPAGALRWNLAELRRAFHGRLGLAGDPLVVTLPDGAAVDLLVLRSGGWTAAMAMPEVGGDLLDGTELDDATAFMLWLEAERQQVRRLWAGTLTDAVRALLARGDGPGALETSRHLLEVAPWSEAAHGLHVLAVAEVEGRDAAERALESAVDRLTSELGSAPTTTLTGVLDTHLGSPRTTSGTATVQAQLEAGRAAVAAGVAAVGVQSLSRAVVGARATGDRHLLAAALLEVGSAMVHAARGTDEQGAGALHEAAAIAVDIGESGIAATAHRELGYIELLQAEYARAAWWLDEAERLAGGDDAELAWVDAVRSLVLLDVGRHGDAAVAARSAVERADRLGDGHAAAFALSSLGRDALLRRDLDGAREVLDASLGRARASAWQAFVPWPEALRAEVDLLDGDVDGAAHQLDHALTLGQQLGDPCWESVALRGLGLLAARRGDRAEAVTLLQEAPRACRRLPDSYRWVEAYGLQALAEVAVDGGHEQAPTWADALVRFAGEHGLRELHVHGLRSQARLGVEGAAALADAMAADVDNPALAITSPAT